ncbi:putative 26S proteasome non-ATPase regulatory subunit 9 [Thermoascus aurantiacus ATCC 26904]
MGIPMDDNINAPTVPSGPRTGRAAPDLSKLSLDGLREEKLRIEAELSALSSVLTSHGVDMNTPLTIDGFPRDDIDVAQIRITRARIIHLRTDHKEVMKWIEQRVHETFAKLQQNQDASAAADTTTTSTSQPAVAGERSTSEAPPPSEATVVETPFAKVNSVVAGSPADQAGLRAGDTIRSFGGINWMNHERLTKVAEVVQQNEGRPVVVKVVRKNDSGQGTAELTLGLVPRRDWGGRGLLGCHLVPL